MYIIVACGGTGGHIFPGLATAQALQRRGHEVALWHSGREVEQAAVRGWSGALTAIPAAGLSGLSWRSLKSMWTWLRSYHCAAREFAARRPDALLAMGGYAAVGPVLAARRHRVPVVLHESNAIPGRACSLLARFAAAVAVHFPVTQDYFRHPRIVVTGMPLRPQLKVEPTASAAKPAAPTPFTVLVMGGSQGAHALNAVATAALIQASSRGLALRAIHLAGVRDEAAVRRAYAEAGVSAEVHAFLAEMWAAYDAATFAICRSGAATCAELAAFGLPALLIPYPHASRGHQKANAQALKAAGAADWMDQDGVNAMWLTEYVLALAANREKRARMRAAALQVAIRDAEDRLAELVESVART